MKSPITEFHIIIPDVACDQRAVDKGQGDEDEPSSMSFISPPKTGNCVFLTL
jgi:hypothetical protein